MQKLITMIVAHILLALFLQLSTACNSYHAATENPEQNQNDSITFYEQKTKDNARLVGKLLELKKKKSTSEEDKKIAETQIAKIKIEQEALYKRLDELRTITTTKVEEKQPIAITKTDTVKLVPSKKTPQPEATQFTPKYLKSESGAVKILLEENGLSYLVYVVDIEKYEVHINWTDTSKQRKTYNNFGTLLKAVYKNQADKVKMMMNGGIFKVSRDAHSPHKPLGLYVENGKELCPLDTTYPNSDNFYLKPNGVFYWNEKVAGVATTQEFETKSAKLKFANAVQSGPMLLIDGAYHPAFKKGSQNVNIRNGVGVTADGKRLIFAISEDPTNFYDFALLFKHFGCIDALYLDGAISRVYMPEKGRNDLNGSFASIITLIQK
jgi:uncharacterized protein YigE (DUF2233 family)